MGRWRSWKMVPLYLTLLLGLLCWGLWASWRTGMTWGSVASGGLLVGVLLSITRLKLRPTPAVALVALNAALAVLGVLWLMRPSWMFAAMPIAAALVAAWYLFWDGWVTGSSNAEVQSELSSLGGTGARGHALIVHHSGKSGYQTQLQRALAEGLVSQGWRVDMTTASTIAPTDLSTYDLLLLGAPVYNWRPARPLLDYVDRLPFLHEKPVALVISGAGVTDDAMADLRRRVIGTGGATD